MALLGMKASMNARLAMPGVKAAAGHIAQNTSMPINLCAILWRQLLAT